jgi:peptidoglycan/xylan/chitin deacetylase (PgdA/CDA1 family)
MIKGYLHRTPSLLCRLYPNRLWHKNRTEKTLYLSFDDGPIPELTPWVLDTLKAFEAKATFFMVGQNVERYPHIALRVQQEGHSIGNHTHRHLNASQASFDEYLNDIQEADLAFKKVLGRPANLFRPPYGRLPSRFAQGLPDYSIVMWDVLSGDFDSSLKEEDCLQATIKASSPGSIVVLHDNLKSEQKLRVVLPGLLAHFKHQGYSFSAL